MPKSVRLFRQRLNFAGLHEAEDYYSRVTDGMEETFATIALAAIPKDGIVLDIGANIGVTASILSQVVYDGHVHAFEASPAVYSVLERNVRENNLRVTPHHLAMSDAPGEIHFSENSAWGFISGHASAPIVRATTIDEFVLEKGLQRLDFIKLDVEGFEWHVLRGATETIRRFKPLIYCEFNCWTLIYHSRVSPLDFAEWLLAKFPQVYYIGLPLLRIPKDGGRMLVESNVWTANSVQDLLLAQDDFDGLQHDLRAGPGNLHRTISGVSA